MKPTRIHATLASTRTWFATWALRVPRCRPILVAAAGRVKILLCTFCLVAALAASLAAARGDFIPRFALFTDPDGEFATVNLAGPTESSTNPFFQDMGTNGRRCVTCHEPNDAFSVTPPHIRERFNATRGTDPIFRPVDGANCDIA